MALVTFPRQFLVNSSGVPRVGAKAYFYQSGTTTAITTYTTPAYSVAHANPVLSVSGGLFPAVYVNPAVNTTYKMVITDSADVSLYTEDNIPAAGLSATDIGSVLYSRTAAEIAAGITPSNYAYPELNASRYGIVYNDSGAATANTTILNALGAATWPHTVTLLFDDGHVYFNDQVSFSGGLVSLQFSTGTKLRYTGTADQPAVIFEGDATATIENFQLDCDTSHDFSDEDCVGLRIINTRGQRIHIKRLYNFTVNCQGWGSSTSGVGYNRIHILRSFNSKYHVDIHSAAANGWINENEWYLTSQQNTSGYPEDADSYGVTFRAESGAYTSMNSNVFYKASFELDDGDGTAERVPVWLDNAGSRNHFVDCRVETGTKVLKVTSDTVEVSYNVVDLLTLIGSNYTGGSDPASLVENDGTMGYGNVVRIRRFGSDVPTVWHSGDLVEKSFASTAARIQTQGMFHEHATNDSGVARYDGTASILNRWIRLQGSTAGIGVYVDTTKHKEFEVIVGSHPSQGCNVAIVCYDSSGTLLTSAGAGHPYVAGSSLTGQALWGYSYRTTGGTAGKLTFRVGDDVATIKVIVAGDGTTAGGYISSLSIYAYQQSVRPYAIRVWSGFPTAERLIDDSPATIRNGGYTLRGTVAHNDDAAAATVAGWQCTASGWNATAWAAATAYVLNEMVENDTGKIYVCTVAGTSAGAGGPTGTGSAVTDNTVTWKYIGTLATWTAGPSNP
jgi:hypothetical protein